jgi:hypothetical protein
VVVLVMGMVVVLVIVLVMVIVMVKVKGITFLSKMPMTIDMHIRFGN